MTSLLFFFIFPCFPPKEATLSINCLLRRDLDSKRWEGKGSRCRGTIFKEDGLRSIPSLIIVVEGFLAFCTMGVEKGMIFYLHSNNGQI